MSELIDKKELLRIVNIHKNAAHAEFSKVAKGNKLKKDYLIKCNYKEGIWNAWEDMEKLIETTPTVELNK